MTVTVRFCGAARTVTGSCYLFQTSRTRLLVDCGLFQGSKTLKKLNYGAFPFNPVDVDAVLLTHAHIDHSGLLPKLVRQGFRGRILATRGTIDLCSCLLPDAGNIQETTLSATSRRSPVARTIRSIPSLLRLRSSASVPARNSSARIRTPASSPSTATATATDPGGSFHAREIATASRHSPADKAKASYDYVPPINSAFDALAWGLDDIAGNGQIEAARPCLRQQSFRQ